MLYAAPGCHLCERARATLEAARSEVGFEIVEVDITGDAELERRYRESLPVVEIDGRRTFAFHVTREGLLRALAARSPGLHLRRGTTEPA